MTRLVEIIAHDPVIQEKYTIFEKYYIKYLHILKIIRNFVAQLDARTTGKGSAKAKRSFNPSHLQQVASCMISGKQ